MNAAPQTHRHYAADVIRRLSVVLCFFALTLTASAQQQTAPPDGLRRNVPQSFVIEKVRLIPRPGEVVENATVVVRDGRVISIGGDIPAGATRVDLQGRTMYAGFIDAYSEADVPAVDETNGYWNKYVTPQRSAADAISSATAARPSGFVARVIAPDTGIIRGTIALASTADTPRVLASDLGMAMRHTAERAPWGTPAPYPRSPMGAVALARQAMYDAQWYRDANDAVEADPTLPAVEHNDALAALVPVADGEMIAWIVCDDERFVLRARQYADEFELDAVAVASGDEYRRADLVAEADLPLVVPVNFPAPPDVTSPAKASATSLRDLMDWDLSPSNVAYLHEREAAVAFTTRGLDDVAEFLPNVRRAIARGLPADAALAMLTTKAADLLDQGDHLGVVEAGKLASFVIADGDLFDPAGEAKIVEVWVEGERYEIEARQPDGLAGVWETVGLKLTLADGDAWKASFAAGDASADAKNLEQVGDGVSFTVDAKPLGQDGVASVSLTLAGGTLRGVASMPDGTRKSLAFDRTGDAAAATQPVKPEGNTPTAGPDEAAIRGGVAPPTELDVPTEDDQRPGTAAIVDENETPKDSEASPDREGGVSETPATTQPSTQPADPSLTVGARLDKSPLFEVNYPLGAYGMSASELPRPRYSRITGATVWSLGEAGVVTNAMIELADGKIGVVADEQKRSEWHYLAADPVDGKRIESVDATGRHITPGLIDAHTHIATDGGINEGTQAVTCEVRIGDFIDPDDIDIYRQLAGGTTAANILHGSANPIGGQNQVVKFRWGVGPEELKMAQAPKGVKFALGENVKQSNWGEQFATRYPQTRMGVQEVFADSFRAAQDYRAARQKFADEGGMPVRRDLELDALVEMLDGDRLIHCHSYRQDEILATMRTLEGFGIKIATFQHILEGYKVAKEMAAHGVGGSTFSDWWGYKFEVMDAIPYAAGIMHEAGVVVSLNSDDAELARRLNTEAAKVVKYSGVSEEEALKMVTLNPAKQLGIDEFVGSLEPGKAADFVVWSGHPLSSTSVVEQTWVDGVKVYDREEHAAMTRKNAEMKAALIQKVLGSGETPAEPGSTTRPSDLWPRHDEACHAFDH